MRTFDLDLQTAIQAATFAALEKRGFRINATIDGSAPETVATLLSKRTRKSTTRYAEVEADGTVNGESLADFLSGL